MSKKSTPASSSQVVTTHCSAKLEPPFVTVKALTIELASPLRFERVLTILAIELRSNDKTVRWEFFFNGTDDLEDKASAVRQASTILFKLSCV